MSKLSYTKFQTYILALPKQAVNVCPRRKALDLNLLGGFELKWVYFSLFHELNWLDR
jgi:hypothetical protein